MILHAVSKLLAASKQNLEAKPTAIVQTHMVVSGFCCMEHKWKLPQNWILWFVAKQIDFPSATPICSVYTISPEGRRTNNTLKSYYY
ncbi:hypothetical protein AAES_40683 [Amazona aestiva]|uniref:Uncharacterized protein n=1 Tax=Amazona aestiva TaxID=12930 RepID=A0A0Q3MSN4_AMAAE|nr:hypothetical protein AAES_40683 [Amazona aestiva]